MRKLRIKVKGVGYGAIKEVEEEQKEMNAPTIRIYEWDEVPKALDSFLLKRINGNTSIILIEWDLTEVEQAVIRGL